MRSTGRAGAIILSGLVVLASCSDDDVQFPPNDAGADAVEDAVADVVIDRGMDSPRPDTPPDLSSDPVVDTGPDIDTADRSDARDTTPTDTAPDSADDTPDVPGVDADATNDAAVDGDDGSRDAISEEPATCAQRCASGVCDANGDCTPCVQDSECMAGRVCNAGTCGPRCGDGGAACTGNLVCCTDHCVDVTRDPQHCGACGTTCSGSQFCGNASTPVCKDSILRNLCDTKKATFLLNGFADDDASSNTLKTAISTLCMPTPVLTSVNQGVSTAINPTTGQPLAGGGELLVAAGGDSTQRLVHYLESSGTSAVYNETDAGNTQIQFKRRGGGADGGDSVLKTVLLATVNPGHDFFLTYVIRDPISGTFSLVVYGIESTGTRAGAFYFANVILPNLVGADVTTFTQAWYLYEWTSADAGGPSMADTFTQIAAGL